MVVEHAHGLRQRRGPNAKSSLHKAHLAPDAGLQAPGASLSFAQGSHDFESLDRGIGRGDRFETAHRLDQYLELSVIGLDHVIEILHLPVGRLPVQLSFALQFGDRCTIARRWITSPWKWRHLKSVIVPSVQSPPSMLKLHDFCNRAHTSIEHSRDWCRSLLILNCQELAAQQPLRPINWCSRLLKMTIQLGYSST